MKTWMKDYTQREKNIKEREKNRLKSTKVEENGNRKEAWGWNKYEYLYTASELGAWNLQQETKLQKLQVIQTLRRQSRE